MTFDDRASFQRLCGPHDINLSALAERLGIRCHATGGGLEIKGDEASTEIALRCLAQLHELAVDGYELYPSDVRRAADIVASGARLVDVLLDCRGHRGYLLETLDADRMQPLLDERANTFHRCQIILPRRTPDGTEIDPACRCASLRGRWQARATSRRAF